MSVKKFPFSRFCKGRFSDRRVVVSDLRPVAFQTDIFEDLPGQPGFWFFDHVTNRRVYASTQNGEECKS